MRTGAIRIGVDTGGTFTDLVLEAGRGSRVVKVPSTPADPAQAIRAGLAELGAAAQGAHVIHGTTVGLNALLTRRLGRAALVTNRGFRDLLEIGRQERPDIYALHPEKPEPVIPRRLRFELDQRSWPDPVTGRVVEVERPTQKALAELARKVQASGAESVAVCLLHSWATPEIEARVAQALERVGLAVTTSAGLVPAFREVERFSTATINAALAPVVGAYIERLAQSLATGGHELSLMQSSGGLIGAERASREPARCLLSGPAGGVRGAARAARDAGLTAVVTLDMGGTSTDVAFHSEERALEAALAIEAPAVAGLPMALPSLDLCAIGCGGGSLAHVDAGGALHVGPASAGADPGPVAYGRAEVPTLTDAFVQLGRIQPGAFLAGGLELDRDAVARAFERLGRELGLGGKKGADKAAEAMVRIARAAMGRAIGAMTLQRGRDPRRLALVAFGGAGGLMAAELARALGMPRALVPSDPGVLSARGLAGAGFEAEAQRTLLVPLESQTSAELDAHFQALEEQLRARAAEEGVAWKALRGEAAYDLRYLGQSFELRLPRGRARGLGGLRKRFDEAHARFFGYALEGRAIELVQLTLRVAQRIRASKVQPPKPRALPPSATSGSARVRTSGSAVEARILDRAELTPGMSFEGPTVVVEYSGTTWVPPGVAARVTAGGHLEMDLA